MEKDDVNNVRRSIDNNNSINVSRRSAHYQPNQWDYNTIQTITNNFMEEAYGLSAKELKVEVRALLTETDPVVQVKLIDSIERLGLGYHFVEEIERLLNNMLISGYHKVVQKDGLHVTAVLFRLFRQHGFMISQDIFDHFKDVNGSFKASLSHDAKGLLSLYQASYLSFKEEITMDAARAFAVTHLKTLDASKLRFAKEIADVMELPSHWRPTRLEARRYIDTYEKEEDTNSALLLFAKLDFNMVQNVHQRELAKVTSWWMGLSLGKTLEFARDRTLECFFVVIIIVFQPHFGYSREGLTKVITLMVLLDDVYDVYGSLDELELFTRAVERWEVEELENLPECMKICFTNISNLVGEMTVDFQKSNGLTILPYLRKAWTDICKAFLVEAKWQNDNYVPTFEEYINNGWMSVSGPLILLHTFPLMGQEITVKALEHLENYPKIIRLASKIFRLYNDLATSTAELERGDSVSSIQCYMRESGDSEVEARKHISSLIFETWKELNEEAILCSSLPRFFIEACVNLGRMAICLYQHGDGFGIPTHDTKAHITSLLMKPISLQSKELQTPINNVVAK